MSKTSIRCLSFHSKSTNSILYFHKVLSGKTVGVTGAVSSWVTVGTTLAMAPR